MACQHVTLFGGFLRSTEHLLRWFIAISLFFQADGIYDNPLDLMDIKPEFSDEETLNDSNTEPKVKSEALWSDTSR